MVLRLANKSFRIQSLTKQTDADGGPPECGLCAPFPSCPGCLVCCMVIAPKRPEFFSWQKIHFPSSGKGRGGGASCRRGSFCRHSRLDFVVVPTIFYSNWIDGRYHANAPKETSSHRAGLVGWGMRALSYPAGKA